MNTNGSSGSKQELSSADPADAVSEQRQVATLLFVDLCDSVGLAARLDTEEYATLIGQFRQTIEQGVRHYGGTIGQYYGDGALILFPAADRAADRAAEAALAVRAQAARLSAADGTPVRIHAGLHAGLVLMREGNARSGTFEAMGLATAIAARLAAAARNDEILVSETTLGPARSRYSLGASRAISIDRGDGSVLAVPLNGLRDGSGTAEVSGLTPFIGRAEELARVETMLAAAQAGDSQTLRFLAPPGQGKSRLASEILRLAASRGFITLSGTSALQGEPRQPFRQMARQMASGQAWPAVGENADANRGQEPFDLERYFPFAAMGPLAGAAPVDPEKMARAMREGLASLSAIQPLLLLFDDWQWSDSATSLLLRALVAAPGRIAILLFSRLPEAGELPLGDVPEILLGPLSDAEGVALVHARLPVLDFVSASRLNAAAGGNPLYLEELCHMAAAADGRLPDATQSGWFAASIEARFRRLPAALQRLVAVAAVIGSTVRQDMLAELADLPLDAAMLSALRHNDLLLPAERPGVLRFKHGLAREILYQLVSPSQRRALHGRIAALLSERDPDAHDAMAHHFAASGEPGLAADHAEKAGHAAAAAYAIDRARQQYRAALAAIDRLPPSTENALRWASNLRRLALIAIYDGDPSLIALFAEAVRRAEAFGDPTSIAQARFWLAFANSVCGALHPAIQHYRAARDDAAKAGQPLLVAEINAGLGHALSAASLYDEALPLLQASCALTDKRGRLSMSVPPSMAYIAAILADRGEFDAAQDWLTRALALVQASGHHVEATIRSWAAQTHLWRGEPEKALHHAQLNRAVTERTESSYMEALARHFAASARYILQPREAELAAMEAADTCLEANGKQLYASLCYARTAETAAALGQTLLARNSAARALRRARAGDRLGAAMAWRVLASLADSPDRAAHCLRQADAVATLRQSPHEAAVNRLAEAQAAVRFDRRADASAPLDAAEQAFQRMAMPKFQLRAAELRHQL